MNNAFSRASRGSSFETTEAETNNTNVIFKVLQTILILLTSLMHPNHGLDLREIKGMC